VAVVRKPVDLVPEQLRSYDRAEWSRSDDEGWWPPFQRWVAARKAWCEAHPGSQALGNGVERMRAEYQAQMYTPGHYSSEVPDWLR
jgi:hypothetical protein